MADNDIANLLDFGDDKVLIDKPTDDFTLLDAWKNGQKYKFRGDGPCPLEDQNEADEFDFYKFGSLEASILSADDSDSEDDIVLDPVYETESTSETVNASLISYFASLASNRNYFDFVFVDNLLHLADINTQDIHGQTLMHEIAREWNTDIAQFLYDRGIHIDTADDYGRTPLMVATASNNCVMVEWLVNHGANISAKSSGVEQLQPIHFAAMFDALEAFKIIVSLGADPNEPDEYQQTPIFIAARNGSKRVCSYLIDLEMPVATYTTYGSTPAEQIVSNMPLSIAARALDQFVINSKQMRTSKFYLSCLGKKRWHMLSVARNTCIGHLIYPTVVETIVRKKDYQLIMHPVILQYISQCSSSFGNKFVYVNAAANVLYTIIWSVDVASYDLYTIKQKKVGDDKKDTGIGLSIFGLLMTFWFAFLLARDYIKKSQKFNLIKHHHNINNDQRLSNIHPRWSAEKHMLENERISFEKESLEYWSDYWVIVDVITLIMAVVHVTFNVINFSIESETLEVARLYYSIFFLFAVWIRMNRALLFLESLGAFINMLALSVRSVYQFGFLFLIFYIPYVCMIFVLFGGKNKRALQVSNNYLKFRDSMYNIFLLTIVGDYDLDTLVGTNSVLAHFTVGLYILAISVICINLYVALLSESFKRVFGDARAMSLVSKAGAMLALEVNHSQLYYRKEKHLSTNCMPLIVPLIESSTDESSKMVLLDAKKRIRLLTNEMRASNQDQIEIFKHMEKCCDQYFRFNNKYHSSYRDATTSLNVLQVHFTQSWYRAKTYSDSIKARQMKAMMEVPVAISRMKDYLVNKVSDGGNEEKKQD